MSGTILFKKIKKNLLIGFRELICLGTSQIRCFPLVLSFLLIEKKQINSPYCPVLFL